MNNFSCNIWEGDKIETQEESNAQSNLAAARQYQFPVCSVNFIIE
jgi:hypothetical protein